METAVKPYTIHIQGPDMDTRFVLRDESDLELLELILTKIRKQVLRPSDIVEARAELAQ